MHYTEQDIECLTEVKKGKSGTGLLIENDGHVLQENNTIRQIKEDISNNDRFVIPEHFVVDAILQKYDIVNANGRIYPKNILVPEVEKYQMEKVSNKCALGSLDHPNSSTISGHDISHNIIEMHWESKTLLGKLELNITPGYRRYGVCSSSGDMAANLLLNGYRIGISSRGVGSVNNMPGGKLVVGDDYELIAWDIVIEPSTSNAILSTNKEELEQYVESDTKMSNKPLMNEDMRSIYKLLS